MRWAAPRHADDGSEGVGAPSGAAREIELFRDYALPNFRDLLFEVARHPAMLFWLDGRLNTKARPQENFAREGHGALHDWRRTVHRRGCLRGARVFTGWNLQRIGDARDPLGFYQFCSTARSTTPTPRRSASRSTPMVRGPFPARAESGGIQDGVDLINALARHPMTARRMAQKLWSFFVSEIRPPDEAFVARIANVYASSDCHMSPVVRAVLTSQEFDAPDSYFARFSWPVEFVARALKEIGYAGISAQRRAWTAVEHGPAVVRAAGRCRMGAWPGVVHDGGDARADEFAATLTSRQRNDIAAAATGNGATPEALLSFFLDRISPAPFEQHAYNCLLDYLRGGTPWTETPPSSASRRPGSYI
jgi:hypothetical protein